MESTVAGTVQRVWNAFAPRLRRSIHSPAAKPAPLYRMRIAPALRRPGQRSCEHRPGETTLGADHGNAVGVRGGRDQGQLDTAGAEGDDVDEDTDGAAGLLHVDHPAKGCGELAHLRESDARERDERLG